MTKKQKTELEKPKAKDALSKNPDYKDILAIVEGRFGAPVKRSGRFINANYPPDDVSMEELQRIWGDPKDFKDDISEAELERIRQRISRRKTKPY